MVRELVNTEARVKVWGGGARDGLKRACWVTVVVTPGWSDPPLRVMSMNYTHKSVPMCVTCPAGRIAKRPVMVDSSNQATPCKWKSKSSCPLYRKCTARILHLSPRFASETIFPKMDTANLEILQNIIAVEVQVMQQVDRLYRSSTDG